MTDELRTITRFLGRVTWVGEDQFGALLWDRAHDEEYGDEPRYDDEYAEILISAVPADDRNLLFENSLFDITLVHHEDLNDPDIEISEVKFYRFPPPTPEERIEAMEWADSIRKLFDPDELEFFDRIARGEIKSPTTPWTEDDMRRLLAEARENAEKYPFGLPAGPIGDADKLWDQHPENNATAEELRELMEEAQGPDSEAF